LRSNVTLAEVYHDKARLSEPQSQRKAAPKHGAVRSSERRTLTTTTLA
jgi:hypothetical protein